ncbi:hypothetical protein [Sorangium atrum]|uniref:Uncharacterized protein n=1 Tax=Sorangium atrum TaxID=2995308 RepID=A0ABT5CE70_9BACT|nr:hypothetical protein [Sorangium aterium]MDC0683421.1 hypothetical protein [Sorangium aterium]
MSYGCLTVTRWNVFLGLSWHEALFWWPMPPPGAYVPQKYWPHFQTGLVSGTHLFSFWSEQKKHEIQLDGVHWIGRGSDASLVVPHVDVVQGWNPLLPWTILFGSSISVWGTSGVAIGCDNPIFGETTCDLACSPFKTVPFSLHLACNSPISLPLDFTIVWGTAKAGFTWTDFIACLVDIAIEIAMDILMKFGGQIAGKLWKGAKAAGKGLMKGAKMAAAKSADLAQPFFKRAGKALARESAEETLAKILKESAEEAADDVASKVGKQAAESFSDSLSRLRSQSDELLEELAEAADGSVWKSFKQGAAELGESAADRMKKLGKSLGAAAKSAKDTIIAVKTWKKVTEENLLKSRKVSSILKYTALANGFKYSKKIGGKLTSSIDAQYHDPGDLDAASDGYSFGPFALGSRSGVYDDLGDPVGDTGDDDEDDETSKTVVGDRFAWRGDASASAKARVSERFSWSDQSDESGGSAGVDDRFAWIVSDAATSGA